MSCTLKKQWFGVTPDGETIHRYTMANGRGAFVQVINFGAIVTALSVPDGRGELGDVTLGHTKLDPYLVNAPHLGAICGRYSNRIANSRFELAGHTVTLDQNHGKHHLHGGKDGFHRQVWAAEEVPRHDAVALKLTYTSKEGEMGYPGTLKVEVTYTWDENYVLGIEYRARTDKTTVLNLTNHAYWNLGPERIEPVLDHELWIGASQYLETTAELIPTGTIPSVDGTPMDFRKRTAIGKRIRADFDALKNGKGYDVCYVVGKPNSGMKHVATAWCVKTGRVMEVHTTEPAVQLYTAGCLPEMRGKRGRKYGPETGLCLETQHYPDSPHHLDFPSTVLTPDGVFESKTRYVFGII